MHFVDLIQFIYVVLIVCILLGHGSPAPNRGHERNPEGVDLDENYRIEVLHEGNVIDSTKTEKGHHTIITVTVWAFSNAFSLDLKLNSFLFAVDYVEKSFNESGAVYHDVNHTEKNCFYLGSVRNEATSSAAVSTCGGIVGYFAVGNISYHIESQSDRLNGPHKVYRSRRDAKSIYRCGHDKVSLGTLLNPSKHARRLKRSFVWPQDLEKKNKIVELYVSNDYSQFLNQGSNVQAVIQRTLNIINIANAGYQPVGIYLICVGIEVWNTGDKISVIPSDKEATLASWADYRKRNINPITYNDNGVLITNNTFNESVIGFAYLDRMCTNNKSAAFVSDIYPLASVAGTVMDHEMGHNFGLQHDDKFTPCTCSDASGKCIMYPSTNLAAPPLTWSQCSLDQFTTSFQQGADLCLYNVPKVVQSNSGYCGNGIVENGEQCDCGNSTSQQCNRACCNANTCQLIAPAICAFGSCCNISTCQLLPCGTLCRKKADASCDLDEFCDGSTALCANDTYVPDGTTCTVIGTAAYCYKGLCRSHRSQCELLWGPGTLESSNYCYNRNSDGDLFGNCGFSWLPNISYIPCGINDTKCGVLQCQNLTRELYTYKIFLSMSTRSFTNGDTCHIAIFDFGLATRDPGLVPNGAECGTGKMCVNQKCIDVQSVLTVNCSGCQANQACNHVGRCQDTTPTCGQTTTVMMPTTRTSKSITTTITSTSITTATATITTTPTKQSTTPSTTTTPNTTATTTTKTTTRTTTPTTTLTITSTKTTTTIATPTTTAASTTTTTPYTVTTPGITTTTPTTPTTNMISSTTPATTPPTTTTIKPTITPTALPITTTTATTTTTPTIKPSITTTPTTTSTMALGSIPTTTTSTAKPTATPITISTTISPTTSTRTSTSTPTTSTTPPTTATSSTKPTAKPVTSTAPTTPTASIIAATTTTPTLTTTTTSTSPTRTTTQTTTTASTTTPTITAITPTTPTTTTTNPTKCSQNLTNTVVYYGSQTAFGRVNNAQPVLWQYSPSSDPINDLYDITTGFGGPLSSGYSSTFALNQSGLIILNSTHAPVGSIPYSTAGLYILSYANPTCITAANLIVIKTGPTCVCNAADPNNVKFTCSVTFAESSIQPSFPILTWKDSNGVQVKQGSPLPTQIDLYLQTSEVQYLANYPVSPTYQCQLNFTAPSQFQLDYVSTLAPAFMASCTVANCAAATTATSTASQISTNKIPSTNVYLTTTATFSTTTSPPPLFSTAYPITTTASITATTQPTMSTLVSTTANIYNCTGQNLTNTVVYEGSLNTTFSRLNNGQAVQWQVIQSSDLYNSPKSITNYDDNVTSQFVPAYAVNGSGLVIFNSTVAPQGSMSYSTAGIYVVKYRNPNCSYAANLIVIRTGPVCSCNASDPNNVKLSCSVDYAESNSQPNNPFFTWKNSSSVAKQHQPVPTSISSYLRRSTSQLQLSSNDATRYECQLTFSVAAKSPLNYLTVTGPNFTASCYISSCAALTTVTTSSSAETTAVPLNCADQNLTNIVAYEGSSTSFQRVKNGQAVQWQVISSSDFLFENQAITNYDDVVVSQFSATYAVTQSQLTILNATVDVQVSMPYATAGLYTLSYRDPNYTTAANLIVISSGPQCSCAVNDPPSTTVTLSCSVDFAGSDFQPNHPIFTWNNRTSVVQQDLPIPLQISSYLKESTSQLQISSDDPTTYTCRLTFSPSTPTQLNYVAVKAPDFTASCDIYSCWIPDAPQIQPNVVPAMADHDDPNITWVFFGIIFGVVAIILVTSAISCWFCRLQNPFERVNINQ